MLKNLFFNAKMAQQSQFCNFYQYLIIIV